LQLAVYQLGCPAASSFTILHVFDRVEKNKQSSIAVVAEVMPRISVMPSSEGSTQHSKMPSSTNPIWEGVESSVV
jgi:hypothetical protein